MIIKEGNGNSTSYSHRLVRIDKPIMRILTLAIHLDRSVDDALKVNTQSHLAPVLATSVKAELNKVVDENRCESPNASSNQKHHSHLLQLLADQVGCKPDNICDFELQACDTQPSIVGGAMNEFIFSGRLDNLCMSFCSLKALIDATESEISLEEETGLLEKAIQKSFLVSADMAHALHPNYMDVVRNDIPCGSTIGPILARGIGIRTVDVGDAQLSMHSIREMCAVDDVTYAYKHLRAFYEEFTCLDAKITVDV